MAITVSVRNGQLVIRENGSTRHVLGSHIVSASTDGEIIATVDDRGSVHEYTKTGSTRRVFGSRATSVNVVSGTIVVSHSDGTIREYVNGCCRRSYR